MIGTRGYFKEGFLMIKLIASDMDGTFLDGNECVPEGSYDLVMRLRDAGIQFVASSGRASTRCTSCSNRWSTAWTSSRRTARR